MGFDFTEGCSDDFEEEAGDVQGVNMPNGSEAPFAGKVSDADFPEDEYLFETTYTDWDLK